MLKLIAITMKEVHLFGWSSHMQKVVMKLQQKLVHLSFLRKVQGQYRQMFSLSSC